MPLERQGKGKVKNRCSYLSPPIYLTTAIFPLAAWLFADSR